MLGAVGLAAVLLGAAYRRWLGGVTGDTLGAASEISETLALAVAAATL
jgi:cobalamin synthase